MVERVPVHVRVGIVLARPADERDVVLDRVLANPVRQVVVGQAGLPLRAPELGRPGEDTEVVVHPVVRAALDRLLRVVLEVVEDRDSRIPRELGAARTDDLVRTQVVRRKVVVRSPGVRPQVHAAERVVRDVSGDVRPCGDRLDHRPDLWL